MGNQNYRGQYFNLQGHGLQEAYDQLLSGNQAHLQFLKTGNPHQ